MWERSAGAAILITFRCIDVAVTSYFCWMTSSLSRRHLLTFLVVYPSPLSPISARARDLSDVSLSYLSVPLCNWHCLLFAIRITIYNFSILKEGSLFRFILWRFLNGKKWSKWRHIWSVLGKVIICMHNNLVWNKLLYVIILRFFKAWCNPQVLC